MNEVVSFQCIKCKSDGVLANINENELVYDCPNGCGIIVKINKFCNDCNVSAVVNPIDIFCAERTFSCPNCKKVLYKVNINQNEKTSIHEQKQPFNHNNKPRGYCKYGLSCRNSSCQFEHPSSQSQFPSKPQLRPQQSSMAQTFSDDNGRSFGPCRYGVNCRNVKCQFQHPIGHSQNNFQQIYQNVPQSQHHQFQEMSEKKRYCKFGTNCHNDKCQYEHDQSQPSSRGICRYGMNCHKENCTYDHPNVQESLDSTIPPLELPPPATNLNLCKYGESCRKPKCGFLHPSTSSSLSMQSGMNQSDVNHKSMKPCKFGTSCKKIGVCPFFHPHLSP